jgi:AAA domain
MMPEREVHILGGSPGSGKTGLGAQTLVQIATSIPVFGKRTFGHKSVFISCDRSGDAHKRRMDAMRLPGLNDLVFHSLMDVRKCPAHPYHIRGCDECRDAQTLAATNRNLESIIQACQRKFPDHRLLFIDAFGSLAVEETYGGVARFLQEASQLCQIYDVTIFGTVHSPKTSKEGMAYGNPRDKLFGSVAWSGFSDLIWFLDVDNPSDPDGSLRTLHILSRTVSGDWKVKLKKSGPEDGGLLVEVADDLMQSLLSVLDSWIKDQPYTRTISKKEIVQYGTHNSISERTVERWLQQQCEDGRLEKPSKGFYRRRNEQ